MLQRASENRSVSPWTAIVHVEYVAIGLDGEIGRRNRMTEDRWWDKAWFGKGSGDMMRNCIGRRGRVGIGRCEGAGRDIGQERVRHCGTRDVEGRDERGKERR